jgi:hypothetical protein
MSAGSINILAVLTGVINIWVTSAGSINICHTAIENLNDSIGYLLDFTNPYYTALAGNMKARAKKDNLFWNHT